MSDLVFTREGGVATITFDRPADQNRVTPEALAALVSIAAELAEDTETQAVVVTGAGTEYFSMGILNPVLRAARSKDEIVALVRLANRAYDALEAVPQIVIAALNGIVRAGAGELALACDIRLAARHATLAFPEARWGGFPGAGAPVRLPMLVGRARAIELMCTGREIDALEMERIGLVQGVYATEQLMPAVYAMASSIASSGPLATRATKRITALRATSGFAAARELSDALRHALEWSHDVDEGMTAHREGRAPRFTGR
jgi:enoyl-CoA hydratase